MKFQSDILFAWPLTESYILIFTIFKMVYYCCCWSSTRTSIEQFVVLVFVMLISSEEKRDLCPSPFLAFIIYNT